MANVEKKEKVQKQTRRPKVKGKTYAKVNGHLTKVRNLHLELATCSKCSKDDDKRIKACEKCAHVYGGLNIVPCIASAKKECPRNIAVGMCGFHHRQTSV